MDDGGVAWSDIGRTNDSGILHMNNVIALYNKQSKIFLGEWSAG
ncbi:MAG: hypothetical protein Ct9H300mP2_2760 [Candidatus Neomarinimicrobiota bacterium]|nr:MAG: hypothetical protein Ct9H300mP2_2760 [Candidatus Neomarinimicrobiota bacterium]